MLGGQDGCERRIEVFLKIQKNWGGGGVGSGRGGGVGLGRQCGCERRIEVFGKIRKKSGGGEYFTILRKFKKSRGGGRGRGNI